MYWNLKAEALNSTLWRPCSGRGHGPVPRQSTWWMNPSVPLQFACVCFELFICWFSKITWEEEVSRHSWICLLLFHGVSNEQFCNYYAGQNIPRLLWNWIIICMCNSAVHLRLSDSSWIHSTFPHFVPLGCILILYFKVIDFYCTKFSCIYHLPVCCGSKWILKLIVSLCPLEFILHNHHHVFLSPRHGPSSGCEWRNGLQYGG
jgi:hypothetical protein